jgi:hypothetical protein
MPIMTQPQIQRAHEEPYAWQFSVFLPNRVGQLNELLRAMAENQLELLGISVFDSTDWAVARIVFSEPDKAREILARCKLAFTECQVLLVVLQSARTLGEATQVLLAAELNVHFAYPLLANHEGQPVMVVNVDDHELAIQALTQHKFKLLGHEDA